MRKESHIGAIMTATTITNYGCIGGTSWYKPIAQGVSNDALSVPPNSHSITPHDRTTTYNSLHRMYTPLNGSLNIGFPSFTALNAVSAGLLPDSILSLQGVRERGLGDISGDV